MAYKLIGQNCAVQISLGGPQDGAPTYTTATDIKAFAKTISKKSTVATADVSTLGDNRDKVQATRGRTEFTVEMLVGATGAQFDGAEGQYTKVEYKELATMASYKSFEGIITGHDLDMPDGAQTERITVMCDAN